MLDKKVVKLLNEQVVAEFYSAYLYLDFANYYIDESLDGFGNWYTIQAQEERDHAMLFIKYLQMNDEKVELDTIAKPDKVFADRIDPLKAGLEHERLVTGLINNIYDAAYQVKDFRTMQFLDWFIKEQMEEEDKDVYKRQSQRASCDALPFIGGEHTKSLALKSNSGIPFL